MRNALVIVVIGSSLWLTTPSTQALGFGRTANATQLGQTLNFAAMIQLGGDETLARECVSAEVYSGENKLLPGQVRVTLEPGADASERSVRITSLALIDEPVVTVNVTVGCGARISRRFVAFIDPPLINTAQADAVEPEKLAPQRFDSQVAPLLAIVQAANGQAPSTAVPKLAVPAASIGMPTKASARKPAPSRQARTASGRSAAAQQQASAQPQASAMSQASATNAKRRGKATIDARPVTLARAAPAGISRLQLEPSPVMAERVASAPDEAASAPTPAAALPDAQAELLAVERQRIQRLEEGTARLIADGKATRDALAQMQSRLQAAESERYANPLVYGLAGLAALLAAAVAVLWRRQQRLAASPQWWAAAEASAASAAAAATAVEPAAEASTDLTATGPLIGPTESRWEASESLRLPAGAVREITSPDPLTMPGGNVEASVDELIDLEQQAEFFVVLGQDDAAVDLLMSHVRSSGGASPLPYLKLLEIYRRCDDRAAYDRIRARFNRRFDAAAPAWGADLALGRSLADYPELLGRLQALWRSPHEVMATLEASLFRRVKTDSAFDLPAYRELLFLFSVARDLSGLDTTDADEGDAVVDLFLPIDDEQVEPATQDMAATRPLPNDALAKRPIALDFDLSMPAALTASANDTASADAAPDAASAALAIAPVPVPLPDTKSNLIDFNDVPSRPGELAYQR